MKNKICILVISLFASVSQAENNIHHSIGDFESYYLNNGMKVLLFPFKDESNVGVSVNIKGGAKNELSHEKGYSHIIEHLSFKNAKNFKNIKEFVTTKSNQWNGVTSKDFTYYYQSFTNEGSNLEDFIRMESERLFNLEFDEKELASEKQIILNELQINDSSSKNQLFDLTNKQLFSIHPYAHPSAGYESTIIKADTIKLKEYYLRTYQPKNIFIVIYGNFDKKLAKKIIEKYFSNKTNSLKNNNSEIEEIFFDKKTQSVIFSNEKINLSHVAWNSPNFLQDPKLISGRILWFSSTIEPFGHIYRKYILNESKKYIPNIISINTNIFNFIDYNPFVLDVNQADNDNYEYVIDSIVDDLEYIDNFSENAFNKMKQSINNEWKNIENSPEALVNNFIGFERLGDWRLYFYFKESSQKASFGDGVSFLKQYIKPNNRNTVTVRYGDQSLKNNISKNYYDKSIDNLQKIDLSKYQFNLSSYQKNINSLEELLNNTQEKQYHSNNNNINLKHIKHKTNGDFVYIKIDNKSKNIELDEKYKTSCMLTSNFLSYDNEIISPEEFKAKIIELNIKLNNDYFSFYIKTPKENVDKTFDLIYTLLDKPAFNEVKFEQIKASSIQKLLSNKETPSIAVKEYINKEFNLYPQNHILYPHSNSELLESISKVTIQNVKECYESYKGYPNALITIIGDLSEQEIDKQVNKLLKFKTNYKYSYLKDTQIKNSDEILLKHQSLHKKIGPFNKSSSFFYGQSIVNVDLKSQDYAKILFAINVFGDGPNSILFNQVREKDGSSYNIKAYLTTQKNSDFSKVIINGSLPKDNSYLTIQTIDESWDHFTSNGIDENQLRIFKEQFNNQTTSIIANENNILSFYSNIFQKEVDNKWMINLSRDINKLTVEDVNKAIHKYLYGKKIFMAYSY